MGFLGFDFTIGLSNFTFEVPHDRPDGTPALTQGDRVEGIHYESRAVARVYSWVCHEYTPGEPFTASHISQLQVLPDSWRDRRSAWFLF